ncbi:hypothetical protein NDU88_003982 [Pleurodeles waltl]|uniref:Uncharacterized protein n=1 Tax=Pleurodeles waltl TaxID=8319 RepID=A0AAV7PFE0_PLEWA|nr:hypothetical protein NDU88_003982 [Pleurodeles waltl]
MLTKPSHFSSSGALQLPGARARSEQAAGASQLERRQAGFWALRRQAASSSRPRAAGTQVSSGDIRSAKDT